MNYPFVVIPEPDESGWTVQFPDLPGATGFVQKLEDLPSEVLAVQSFWLEDLDKDGREHPAPSHDWDPINRQPDDFTVGKVYTTKEVSELLELSVRRVNALSNARGLGEMIGKAKVFTMREIENMKHRTTGRPKTS